MKILHINSYYSVSNFYKNFFEEQIKENIDINVFVPVSKTFKLREVNFGCYTKVSFNHSELDRYSFFLKQKKIYNDIKKKYTISRYSIIHAHSLYSNGYVAMKLKENYNIPYIVAVRNTDVNGFFRKLPHLRKIGIKIMLNADKVIFLSEAYRDVVLNNYVPSSKRDILLKKIEIIPNGIDDYWFENKGEPKEIKNKGLLKILYVGRINMNKNLLTTINALDVLKEKGYKIQFTVVGEIQDRRLFSQIVNTPYLKYLKPKLKSELINIYRNHDIFIMPSKTESFGLVYAEAMSQGLPVIYSKNQGFDHQFKNGEIGYSVESSSSIEIVERVEDILGDYVNISKNALEKVNKFKWSCINSKYVKLYKNIL